MIGHYHTGVTDANEASTANINGQTDYVDLQLRVNDNNGSNNRSVVEFDELSGSVLANHSSLRHNHNFSATVNIPSH